MALFTALPGLRSTTLAFLLLLLLLVAFPGISLSDPYWILSYGGSERDLTHSSLYDGGAFLVAGRSSSFGSGGSDVWVLRLDGNGFPVWERAYGGVDDDWVNHVAPTGDGGYIMAGYTYSFGQGMGSMLVLRVDGSGSLLWSRAYGEPDVEGEAMCVVPTSDGNFALVGSMWVADVDRYDLWIVKIDQKGDILWQKRYYGSYDVIPYAAVEGPDGSIVVVGESSILTHGGESDGFVARIDGSDGSLLWARLYVGHGDDYLYSVVGDGGGGFVVGGSTGSLSGSYDFWLMDIDGDGNISWSMAYGGQGSDELRSISAAEGGFLLAGSTTSFGRGGEDALVLKVDMHGSPQWVGVYGGSGDDEAYSVLGLPGGGVFISGMTESRGDADGDALVLRAGEGISFGSNCGFETQVSMDDLSVYRGGFTARDLSLGVADTHATPGGPVAVETDIYPENVCGTPGDADGSGSVDIVDALVISRHALGLYVPFINTGVSDLNGNRRVDTGDALLVCAQCF